VNTAPTAHIKQQTSHFEVTEDLGMEFSGSGEHVYFYVEKESLNTADVASQLAQSYGLRLQDVGYAGLKDKHAVTRQWFSVPVSGDRWQLDHPDVRCLEVQRHNKKLRRGDHRGNRFKICLSNCAPDVHSLVASMAEGFPNFFGPQRVSCANVTRALDWLANSGLGPRPAGAQPAKPASGRQRGRSVRSKRQGWHMSVLRSHLFNAVLEQRRVAGNHAQLIDGDVEWGNMPTGPLWGRGRSATAGLAAEIERHALASQADTCAALDIYLTLINRIRTLTLRQRSKSYKQACFSNYYEAPRQ
jgi:tRNA pseudouridine13 synthase